VHESGQRAKRLVIQSGPAIIDQGPALLRIGRIDWIAFQIDDVVNLVGPQGDLTRSRSCDRTQHDAGRKPISFHPLTDARRQLNIRPPP
jgi:hypothetical protein